MGVLDPRQSSCFRREAVITALVAVIHVLTFRQDAFGSLLGPSGKEPSRSGDRLLRGKPAGAPTVGNPSLTHHWNWTGRRKVQARIKICTLRFAPSSTSAHASQWRNSSGGADLQI